MDFDVLPSVVEPLFERTVFDIGRRHVADQGHQDVVVVLNRGVQVGVGRLDVPAKTAPDVQLPRRVKTDVPQVRSAGDANPPQVRRKILEAAAAGRVAADLGTLVLAEELLLLSKEVAAGDSQFSSGFHHPQGRDAQRQVLLVRHLDQHLQRGVVQDRPPLAVIGRLADHLRIVRVNPPLGHLRRRPPVIGADLQALVEPGGKGRATQLSASAQQEEATTAGAERQAPSRHRA